MKAVRIHSYGEPDVLLDEDAPRPKIAADEVLIRVQAAAVNPLDCKVRAGYFKQVMPHKLPLILGWDVAGEIVEAGSEVSNFHIADAVYALADMMRDGAYAEFIAVRAADVAPKPTSLNPVQAACVPMTGLTAWQALFHTGKLSPGQTALIHGAAGGVGSFAVQFAKLQGAEVIGTASAKDRDYLLKLGVDQVIDYKATPFEDLIEEIDFVLDTIGNDVQERSLEVMKEKATLVSTISPPSRDAAAFYGIRGKMVMVHPSGTHLSEIGSLIDSGRVKARVGTVLPLTQARRAHELIQSGTHGKIVLQVDNEC